MAKLLTQGYSFLDAIQLVQRHSDVSKYLEQGMDIQGLLLTGHRGSFYEHLRFFLNITSLQEAISSALAMESFEKGVKQRFLKQTSYPILIFAFSFVTLYVFSSMIIPQLMQSFDLSQEQSFLTTGVALMQGFAITLMVLVMCFLLLVLCAKVNQKLKITLLERCRFTSLPQAICSYRLAGYYVELIHHGIPTRPAFSFLIQLNQASLLNNCVKQIVAQLEDGDELSEILGQNHWISDDFLQCWRIGMHTQDMQASLKQYMERQEELWSHQIKQAGFVIQAIAYSFVAMMVVLVYQIMLVPLQILETM